MADLLDANVLLALAIADHEHHQAVRQSVASSGAFAICPLTEGALIRTLLRLGESTSTIDALLDGFHGHPGCVFWPDDISYREVDLGGLTGHRQVTDSYLVALAVRHGGRVLTFDKGLQAIHPDHAVLLV